MELKSGNEIQMTQYSNNRSTQERMVELENNLHYALIDIRRLNILLNKRTSECLDLNHKIDTIKQLILNGL